MTTARLRHLLGICILVGAVAGACSLLPGSELGSAAKAVGGPYPAACPQFDLSARRCEFIVTSMAKQLDVDLATAREVDLLGDPGCGGDPHILCTRTTSFVVRVRFVPAAGAAREDSVFCGVGGQYELRCTENPEVRISSPVMDGYRDVPCAGEPPDGCATPVPSPDPVTASRARALLIPTLDVRLDHVGAYDIDLGGALLPNGILTDASFSLANLHATDFMTSQDGISLTVVDSRSGERLVNVYDHGRREGLESVDVHLVFRIESAEPGARLQVRDVIVR